MYNVSVIDLNIKMTIFVEKSFQQLEKRSKRKLGKMEKKKNK